MSVEIIPMDTQHAQPISKRVYSQKAHGFDGNPVE